MAYRQGLDNGVLENPKNVSPQTRTYRAGNWEDLLDEGENSKGFTAVTPNGVSRISGNTLVHRDHYGIDEDGSHSDFMYRESPPLPRGPERRRK